MKIIIARKSSLELGRKVTNNDILSHKRILLFEKKTTKREFSE